MLTVHDLYDLSHSLAGAYLKQFTYPWEALAGISDWILEIGKRLPGLVRHLCIELVDEGLIGLVLTAAAHGQIGDRIGCLLRGVFDVGVVKRLRVLRKRGCVVWDVIDPGLHIRFDRYLWLKADDSLSCQKRIMHILHIRICIFRERFPTVILINGHGIPAQVE